MNEFVAFDLDGTLLRGQSQRLLLGYLFRRRVISVRKFLEILLWFALYRVGLASHPSKVMATAFSFLRGWRTEDADALWDAFFAAVLRPQFYDGALALVAAHKAEGRRVVWSRTPWTPS